MLYWSSTSRARAKKVNSLQIGTKDILGKVDEGKLQSTSQVGLLDHKKVGEPAHATPNGSKNIKDAVKELRTQGKIQKPIGIQ